MIDMENYFKKSELLPAIIQEKDTGEVLMLAYMNRESLKKTINGWFQTDICSKSLSDLTETQLQKVIFCRWMLYRPRLLVLVNPFIGGCINMNESSMENIRQIAGQGTGVLILSTNELPYPILNDSRRVLTTTGELKERIHRI